MALSRTDLLRTQAFINGEWVNADQGKTFAVNNPFDGQTIAEVPDCGVAETQRAIDAAHAAFDSWRKTTAIERETLLRRWADLLRQHTEDLATILTMEQGKPLSEARGEIAYGLSFVDWFASEARRVYGDVIPADKPNFHFVVIKQPVGVVAAITPWNFPTAMITRKCAPALAAGCTVVIKPAEDTPLSALALAVLAEEAGFPKGVINIITSQQAAAIGKEMCANTLVRKLSFTGSTEVGRQLMAQCAPTIKKLSLELGGNAPFIVFDDANLDQAIEGLIASKFRNMGQTCVCANRIFLHKGIREPFIAKLEARLKTLKVGNGLEEGIDQGPLINMQGMKKVERLVADAIKNGAKLQVGGKRHPAAELCYEPTLLTDIKPEMAIAKEEIFGPVVTVTEFEDDNEVVHMANDTPFGLASYFYSDNIHRVWRVAEGLEYGMVSINTGLFSSAAAPFGGVKQSGIGREGSKYGIDEYVEIKYLCMGAAG